MLQRRLSACVNLGESGSSQISVVATFSEEADGWTVELSLGGSPGSNFSAGKRRLRLATLRLCELDIAIELNLRKGRIVKRKISRDPIIFDGPHKASEQILPLLLPIRFTDSLYRYQRQGVAWLLRNNRAILGDDMGLGKTAQALASARRLIRSGRVAWVLIIAPRTLIANWVAEAAFWAPELTTATAIPSKNEREVKWARLTRRAHFLVTTYEQIRTPTKALLRNPPDLIVADEAHRLRNLESLATQGISRIKAKRLWALSGTPLERDAADLAVILSLLDPTKFSVEDKNLPTSSLRAQLRPFLLRRRKTDQLKELPQVIEENEILDLSAEQKDAYVAAIREYKPMTTAAGYLPLFNRLRMLCDVEPRSGASTKLDRTVELIDEITILNEKVVVFSYMLEPLNWLQRRLREVKSSVIVSKLTGEMTLEERAIALEEFISNSACKVLLASTRIASEGLTLTVANNVIFINQWWNPSSNAQARDRVVRIGQTRTVRIKSFTCKGTVEDRLQTILEEKSLSFNELVDVLSQPPENFKYSEYFE